MQIRFEGKYLQAWIAAGEIKRGFASVRADIDPRPFVRGKTDELGACFAERAACPIERIKPH